MFSFEMVVEPDYGQFYLLRHGAEYASERVPSEGYEWHLWSTGGFAYVGTFRKFGSTSVTIQVLDARPASGADDDWQHLAEVSLDQGGALQVLSWGEAEPVAAVPLPDVPVRVRCAWTGLVDGRFEGLDENGGSDEALIIQVWPEAPHAPQVVRWWSTWILPPAQPITPDGQRQLVGLEPVMSRIAVLEHIGDISDPYPPLPGGGINIMPRP